MSTYRLLVNEKREGMKKAYVAVYEWSLLRIYSDVQYTLLFYFFIVRCHFYYTTYFFLSTFHYFFNLVVQLYILVLFCAIFLATISKIVSGGPLHLKSYAKHCSPHFCLFVSSPYRHSTEQQWWPFHTAFAAFCCNVRKQIQKQHIVYNVSRIHQPPLPPQSLQTCGNEGFIKRATTTTNNSYSKRHLSVHSLQISADKSYDKKWWLRLNVSSSR